MSNKKNNIFKITAPPDWGIDPVPDKYRVLNFLDYFTLWGSLGIGLLVLLAGSFLVPGLSFKEAFLAIIIGSAVGCFLLSLIGVIGSNTGAPTMVIIRSVLGVRGSYIPSIINIIQLVGWTIFELVIMGYTANNIVKILFNVSNYYLFVFVFLLIIIFMTISGITGVVRTWLRKYAIWIVILTTSYLTYHLLTSFDIIEILKRPGNGDLPFWSGIDMVIAMPISWLPLVADYNRFSKNSKSSFWGTFLGNFLANTWLYAIGALLLIASNFSQETKGFLNAMIQITGWMTLLILLVDETKEGWADLYSSVVSLQNILPKIKTANAAILLGLICFIGTLIIDITQYQNFLYLIGSVFIPLFAILITDYFIVRKSMIKVDSLYRKNGEFWYHQGLNISSVIIWFAGIIIYQLFVRNFPYLGASFPTFITVGLIYLIYKFLTRI